MITPEQFERRFRSAGLPSFIAERTAAEDVWTRAVPLLTLVLLAEVLGAIDLRVSLWVNLAFLALALGLVLGSLVALNALRGHRWQVRPYRVGRLELAAFVVVPALLPLVLNQQPVSAAVTGAGNVLLLLLVYGVIGYGIVSIVTWATRRLVGQLAASLRLLARAVPLLLLFSIVLFVNTEMWQVFGELELWRLLSLQGLLATLAAGFLVLRAPREVEAMQADLRGTAPELDRRERVNVALVLLVAQGLQVAVVAIAVGGFFVALGLLTMSTEVITSWTGAPANVLVTGSGFALTSELLRVSATIAGIAGLYYTIGVATDPTYREEFTQEITEQMRTSFVDRAAYRDLLD